MHACGLPRPSRVQSSSSFRKSPPYQRLRRRSAWMIALLQTRPCVTATESGDSDAAVTTEWWMPPRGSDRRMGFLSLHDGKEQSEGQSTTVFQDGPPLDGTPRVRTKRPDEVALEGSDRRRRFARYRVDSLLGRGSMARVYKARHLGLDRDCALKIMDPRLMLQAAGRSRAVLGRGPGRGEPGPPPRR